MKIYVIEYDIQIIKLQSGTTEIEHREEAYFDISKFIESVKYLQGKWYISNIKTYAGELDEIDVNKVLNPF